LGVIEYIDISQVLFALKEIILLLDISDIQSAINMYLDPISNLFSKVIKALSTVRDIELMFNSDDTLFRL